MYNGKTNDNPSDPDAIDPLTKLEKTDDLADQRLAYVQKGFKKKLLRYRLGIGALALMVAGIGTAAALDLTRITGENEALRLLLKEIIDDLDNKNKENGIISNKLHECKRQHDEKLTLIARLQPFISDLWKCYHERNGIYAKGRCFEKAANEHADRQKKYRERRR